VIPFRSTIDPFRRHPQTSRDVHVFGEHLPDNQRLIIHLRPCEVHRCPKRAAYNRAQRLAERHQMMQAWADYLDGGQIRPVQRAQACHSLPTRAAHTRRAFGLLRLAGEGTSTRFAGDASGVPRSSTSRDSHAEKS